MELLCSALLVNETKSSVWPSQVFLGTRLWVYFYIHKILLSLLATACICSIDISMLIFLTVLQQLSGRSFQLEHSLEILFSLEELCNIYTESYLPSADPTT